MTSIERSEDVLEAIAAARELSHAACYLADIAARVTKQHQLPEISRASALALEASIRAAETAFSLDDVTSRDLEEAAILWLAIEAIGVAEETIDLARSALESLLPATVAR